MNSFIMAALDSASPPAVGTVRIDLQNSSFIGADGQPIAAPVLASGMTVQVMAAPLVGQGPSQIARATSVRLAEQLLGPVAEVTTAASGGLPSGFILLGQTVALTARTLIDPALGADAGALRPGMVLRVWGELDAVGGRIVATRADLPPQVDEYRLRGLLSALDLAQGSARIGGLNLVASPEQMVHWAAALALGQLVRARVAASDPGQPQFCAARRHRAVGWRHPHHRRPGRSDRGAPQGGGQGPAQRRSAELAGRQHSRGILNAGLLR